MIVLPYPHKSLWPNAPRSTHWGTKAREFKKHKQWAYLAMRAATFSVADSPIPVHITVCPKRTGPAPDRDNVVSASKAYIDGIADYLCVNDRFFAAPTVSYSDERTGQFIITIGEGEKP